ncbi:hypothetical protein [Alkaliphilus serpentinus]|uniref:Uncharacterized protein n=1 Tax=Alkaliphilus serpentinus TaxID=1482731 RepID=A0A833HMY6_9FIRM|nr:hypothetical protein [Alkaliphilus serpentinus]KAB3529055.1 hypothetical protein F8153_10395 [Alkaliphilus serpentinus]
MDFIYNALEKSDLEDIFPIDMEGQGWIWINEDIYFDILNNAVGNDGDLEDYLTDQEPVVYESVILDVLRQKMRDKGWMEVNQILFHEIYRDFIPTSDIKTYIFTDKRFFLKNVNRISRDMEWIYKAMAIDAYQHLIPEEGTLEQIFDRYFNDNFIILEGLIVGGSYSLNQGEWKYNKKENSLIFRKKGKEYRRWAEGNTNSVFRELTMNEG